MRFAGADGCRAGWVVAWMDETGRFAPLTLHETLAEVVAACEGVGALLIDIPMGLREQGGERTCDLQTRRLLGRRGSTLFRVPVRSAVYAPTREAADALNRAATGKGISAQAFGICRKIAEADRLLQANPGLRAWVHESHPEACFGALNGWEPLLEKKKGRQGQERRLAILARHAANAAERLGEGLTRHRRSQVAADDLIDAMVLALSARLAHANGLPALPQEEERDPLGLPMR
ncbi:MAG: DUF429 domain-containing protein, partial [Bacillota bacterium]